jgi:hypothetical protein
MASCLESVVPACERRAQESDMTLLELFKLEVESTLDQKLAKLKSSTGNHLEFHTNMKK